MLFQSPLPPIDNSIHSLREFLVLRTHRYSLFLEFDASPYCPLHIDHGKTRNPRPFSPPAPLVGYEITRMIQAGARIDYNAVILNFNNRMRALSETPGNE